jgi:hypothetical protein
VIGINARRRLHAADLPRDVNRALLLANDQVARLMPPRRTESVTKNWLVMPNNGTSQWRRTR